MSPLAYKLVSQQWPQPGLAGESGGRRLTGNGIAFESTVQLPTVLEDYDLEGARNVLG